MPRLHTAVNALIFTSLFSLYANAAETTNGESSETENSATKTLNEHNNRKEDIIISASRVPTKRIESGSSVTIIDAKYLQQNQARSVAEILHDVPGVSVNRTGGFGKQTSVFLRGASSQNTVVIIDGVKVSDLSSSNGGFDFANLLSDDIEQIEVLRGPQSAIWGSDAMGGVINIITKQGRGDLNGRAHIEFGAHNYNKQSFNVNGATSTNNYSLSAYNVSTDGISSKTGRWDDPDDDSYKNQNVTFRGGQQLTKQFSLDMALRYTQVKSEYDVNLFPVDSGINNDNNYSKKRERSGKVNAYLNLLDARWKNRLSIAYSDTHSENFEPQGYYGPYTKNSGDDITIDMQSDYFFATSHDLNHRITVLGETEHSTFRPWSVDDKQTMDSSAIVGEYAIDWAKNIFLVTSLRHDFNSDFDDTDTHKVALTAWLSDGFRFHASQGSGVRNPTFSQLYGAYSTPNLNPEKSKSWDTGLEYNFASMDGYIDVTYFDANYEDAIRWDPTAGAWGEYVNQDEDSKGIEVSTFANLTSALRINSQYTYMKTHDGTAQKNELLRRPKHSASVNMNYMFSPAFSSNLALRYVGERSDYGDRELPSHTIVNLAAAYQVNDNLALNARIDNLFDKDYVEISDYGTDSATLYIGFTIH
ncbi:TonB-dependent receptor [Psychromonas sp. MME2]|uniref:TonB-dependent receptor plug domain-containing protein n=1 Tax=unclassified Psychromonas TaxID=2614957 RepID=UPI00339BDE88